MTSPFPASVRRSHTAVVGTTGSGKTSTSKLLVEEIAADPSARVCIIDPLKSDWWGLTSSASGKAAGLPFYILGGPRGHVPLHAAAGKALGEIVGKGDLRLSIIDMADFGPGEPQRFFVDFASALFRHAQGVLYLVIEEAHVFAPKEKGWGGEKKGEAMSIHWMSRLATAARSKGVRLIVCTQRTQKLHNDILGSCETLIAHKLTLPANQKPVLEWIEGYVGKKAVEFAGGNLPRLRTGHALVATTDPEPSVMLTEFPKFKTFDNTATPDGTKLAQIKTAPIDREKLVSILGAAVAEAEANDPKKLKAEIERLKKEMVKGPDFTKRADNIVAGMKKEIAHVTESLRAELAVARESRDIWKTSYDNLVYELGKLLAPVRALPSVERLRLQRARDAGALAADALQREAEGVGADWARAPVPQVRQGRAAAAHEVGDGGGGGAEPSRMERRFLAALAQRTQGRATTRAQLLTLAGYAASGPVSKALAQLACRGWITRGNGEFNITSDGLAALGSYEVPPTGQALREWWLSKLSTMEAKFLGHLMSRFPAEVNRSALLADVGYAASGPVSKALAKLVRIELVEKTSAGLRAHPNLFEE